MFSENVNRGFLKLWTSNSCVGQNTRVYIIEEKYSRVATLLSDDRGVTPVKIRVRNVTHHEHHEI